jgi:hypothetical protein
VWPETASRRFASDLRKEPVILHHKTNHNRHATGPAGKHNRVPITTLVLLAVAIVLLSGVGWILFGDSTPKPAAPPAPATPAAAAKLSPAFARLKGSWRRPDGGYVIEVRSVAEDGKIDASYLNPRPIHVAKAEASLAGDTVKMFVELQDANYPGSTYDLAYDPQADQLKGIYFQALQKQRFEVDFERLK